MLISYGNEFDLISMIQNTTEGRLASVSGFYNFSLAVPKKLVENCKVAIAVSYDLEIMINPTHNYIKNTFLLTTYFF
jgi:hypothetical protein